MPLVFRKRGFRFHFYSSEGDPLEPIHIHVTKDGADAKFWLYPDVDVEYNYGFDARTQSWLSRTVAAHRQEIEDAWHDHFG